MRPLPPRALSFQVVVFVLAFAGLFAAFEPTTAAAAVPVVYTVGSPAGAQLGYIDCYAPAAPGPNGAVPFGQITGPATKLLLPQAVAASTKAGRFFVADFSTNSVEEFALPCPSGSVNIPPVKRVAGAATTLHGPSGIAVDAVHGVFYVANSKNNSISMFPLAANGNVPPICVLAGPATQLHKPMHIAIEPDFGNVTHLDFLYVVNNASLSVTVYPPGSCGNTPPAFMIQGPATMMASPDGIDVFQANFGGHAGPGIFVTDTATGDVFVYTDGPPANQPPFQILGGAGSTLLCPTDVRVSRQTLDIYVIDPCATRIDAFQNAQPFNTPPFRWYAPPPGAIPNPQGIWLRDRN